jgi:hypothetical protein
MKKGGNWTPEQDAQLKVALQQKTSVQRLAVRFDVSQAAIVTRARVLGLALPANSKMNKKVTVISRWVAKRRPKPSVAPQLKE